MLLLTNDEKIDEEADDWQRADLKHKVAGNWQQAGRQDKGANKHQWANLKHQEADFM